MFPLPPSEEKRAAYLKRIKPELHAAFKDRDNLHRWIAELDGRLPRRDETIREAASFISSFDPKERKKDKGYKFFGMPYDELNALKDLLSKEHDKMSYSEEDYNPTGIGNPADYIGKVTIEKDTDNDGDIDTKIIKVKGE